MDLHISPACLHRTTSGNLVYIPTLAIANGSFAEYRKRFPTPNATPIAPRVIKLCARCQTNEVKRKGDHCVDCALDHFYEYQQDYRRRKRRGSGECAKCQSPRVKRSAYCLEHRRESDRIARRRQRAAKALITK